jgi:Flp pilus assembly protein TadD
MTLTPLNDRQEAKLDPQLEYRALVRSLEYTQGFGLLFVQCSPAEGARLIARVQQDLPQKRIEVLSLTEPIETLYDKVDDLDRNKPIDVLFVQGIEHSLYDYEKNRLWSDEAQRWGYSEMGVPRLLQHLNLSRERFRENFNFHFVFLVPHFIIRYLTRRAPDFFDWNSGVLEFAMDREQLRHASEHTQTERFLRDNPEDLTLNECRKNLFSIQSLLEEAYQTEENKAGLLWEQARIFNIMGEEEAAISNYNKILQLRSEDYKALYNLGTALGNLGRYEEAITSYDKVLQLKPEEAKVLVGRGILLRNLGRYEEAIIDFNKALEINPYQHEALHNRGIALDLLGQTQEAISNYNTALMFKIVQSQINPHRKAWDDFSNAGYYEKALGRWD